MTVTRFVMKHDWEEFEAGSLTHLNFINESDLHNFGNRLEKLVVEVTLSVSERHSAPTSGTKVHRKRSHRLSPI